MRITCFGGSLTYGNVGYSYILFLDKKFQTVNKGKKRRDHKGQPRKARKSNKQSR